MSTSESSVTVLSPPTSLSPAPDGTRVTSSLAQDAQRNLENSPSTLPPPSRMVSSPGLMPKSPVPPTSLPDTSLPPGESNLDPDSEQRVQNGPSQVDISSRKETNPSGKSRSHFSPTEISSTIPVELFDGVAPATNINTDIACFLRSSMEKANNPPITIPPPQTTTTTATTDGQTLSRKSSHYVSVGGTLSKQNSLASLTASRPAPPSPASRTTSRNASRNPSRRTSQILVVSRRHSQTSDRVPSHRPSLSSMRKVSGTNTPSGLTFTPSRRSSGLFNALATLSHLDGQLSPQTEATLERIGEGVPVHPSKSPVSGTAFDASNTIPSNPSPSDSGTPALVPATDPKVEALRRNLSSTSASTSGSSSSTVSNVAARHASELEAAYAAFLSPSASQPRTDNPSPMESYTTEEVEEGNISTKSNKTIVDMGDAGIEWHRLHPIIVRDYAYSEEDKLFSALPIEAIPLRERSKYVSSQGPSPGAEGRNSFRGSLESSARRNNHNRLQQNDDDDGWGFPMGIVSGGGAPLGTTRGTARRDLRNRNRAWGSLGTRGVGGLYADVSQSEEESSGHYEESEEDEFHFGNEIVRRNGDENDSYYDEDYDGDTYTPSNPRPHFGYFDSHFSEPDGDEHDGVLGDEDISDYSPSSPSRLGLQPGVYRVLYGFVAEGNTEITVSAGQLVRIIGRGGDEGWAVAQRHWSIAEARGRVQESSEQTEYGLVPECYLEPYHLDDDEMF